jgi:DNA-binding NarL/FixJ family response regulator
MDLSRSVDVSRVLLVDDHAIVRRGLSQLFEREPDFTVCGEAATETEAFDLIESLDPHLLVTDLTLEGRSGLDLIKRVHAYHEALPVLVVSMHDETLYAHRALAAGAQGYVMKRRADIEVLKAARMVRDGLIYSNGNVGGPASSPDAPPGGERDPVAVLTDREFEVFLLIGEGFTPRHIAEKLSLSVSTVEVYRERIKAKLALESSPLLLRYAVRWCKDRKLS